MHSPVLFLIFNRPDVTRRVFNAIRMARPPKLYIAADGPRMNKAGEAERCKEVQDIVSRVDWPCEVNKLIREDNLGCRLAISDALDWFFLQEPEGIILEDDCLPDPSFFQYCDELLERYRGNDRVGMISGCNFQSGIQRGEGSYYFSQFCHIWGWATWARAWKKYDVKISQWPELKHNDWLASRGFNGQERRHWEKAFDKVFNGKIDTWDHQWTLTCWINNMLAVMPNTNLISNIGFGESATHTVNKSIYANMTKSGMVLPLIHPPSVTADADADIYTSKRMFTNSILWRIFRKLKAYA
jgi:hypothetical protein